MKRSMHSPADHGHGFRSSRISRLPAPFKIAAGFVLLLVGAVLALPGIPGPGLAIMALGLWFLSEHFRWARESLAWARERFVRIRRWVDRKRGGDANNGPRSAEN